MDESKFIDYNKNTNEDIWNIRSFHLLDLTQYIQ